MPEPRRSAAGFTLLELALVIAIAAILAAGAIPAYRGYIERVNDNRAQQDIQTLMLDLYRWRLRHGTFPEDLATAGLDGMLDPWGRSYVYLNIATADSNDVRKDKNLHPLNTDFDLYSFGSDGASKLPLTARTSWDDIIRANNGAFIGRAKDY